MGHHDYLFEACFSLMQLFICCPFVQEPAASWAGSAGLRGDAARAWAARFEAIDVAGQVRWQLLLTFQPRHIPSGTS